MQWIGNYGKEFQTKGTKEEKRNTYFSKLFCLLFSFVS